MGGSKFFILHSSFFISKSLYKLLNKLFTVAGKHVDYRYLNHCIASGLLTH